MSRQVRTTGPLNKTALGEAVAAELGVSLEQGHQAVAAVLNTIARTVASGHSVTVTNFGSWTPKHVAARKVRNPQTDERFVQPASTRLAFRISDHLRDVVKAQDPSAADITKRPKGGAR